MDEETQKKQGDLQLGLREGESIASVESSPAPENPEAPPDPAGDQGASDFRRLDEEDLEVAEREVVEGQRVVVVQAMDGPRELKLIRPRPRMDEQAGQVFSRVFSRCLRDPDILTEAQMLEILKTRGIWDEEKEARIEELDAEEYDLARDIEKIQKEVASADAHDHSKKRKQKQIDDLEDKRRAANTERMSLQETRNKYMGATAEGIAGVSRRDYLMQQCILDAESGKPIWPQEGDWDQASEEDPGLFAHAIYQVLLFWSSLPGSSSKDLEAF